jgi:hypothetical protein
MFGCRGIDAKMRISRRMHSASRRESKTPVMRLIATCARRCSSGPARGLCVLPPLAEPPLHLEAVAPPRARGDVAVRPAAHELRQFVRIEAADEGPVA